MSDSAVDDLRRELPHVIVLLGLLLILLVVVTKFKWIHSSQVPGNWHDVYCGDICVGNSCFSLSGGKSRVALVYDNFAMGDWQLLQNRITRERLFTLVEPIPERAVSAGLLNDYELVILHNKRITNNEAKAVQAYLASGGTVLLMADAATEYYLTGEELANAELENQTRPGWYEYYVNLTSNINGFGPLAGDLGGQYLSSQNATNFEINTVLRTHLIMQSFPNGLTGFPPLPFTVVSHDPRYTTELASLTAGENTYPAILETKLGIPFFARTYMMYVSFPIENAGEGSTTLLQNLMDYLVVC